MGEIKLEERHISGDLEEGPGGTVELVLTIECPECGGSTRHPARTIKADTSVAICPGSCGHTTNFTGGDLEEFQRSLDELMETFKSLGADWRVS